MTEQLKPCPFCGENASKTARFNMGYFGDGIKCSKCKAETPSYLVEQKAIDWWNTRADGWLCAKNNPPPKSCQVIAEWSNGDIEQSSYITDWGKPHFQRKCGTDENGTGWTGNVGYVINWMSLPSPSAK